MPVPTIPVVSKPAAPLLNPLGTPKQPPHTLEPSACTHLPCAKESNHCVSEVGIDAHARCYSQREVCYCPHQEAGHQGSTSSSRHQAAAHFLLQGEEDITANWDDGIQIATVVRGQEGQQREVPMVVVPRGNYGAGIPMFAKGVHSEGALAGLGAKAKTS